MNGLKIDDDTVGVALLVSNDYKSQENIKHLSFTHEDANEVETLFRDEFNYAICRKQNITRAEFWSLCKSLAMKKYPPTCNRILVYYSGHGAYGTLLMQDGSEVNVDEVTSLFENSKTLAGVVKIFFLDACRVLRGQFGHDSDNPMKKKPRLDDAQAVCKGNILVAYAPTQYHRTYGGPSGSQWTDCLVEALKESKGSDSVFDVLTVANKKMGHTQSSEFTSTMKQIVRFKQEASTRRKIIVLGSSGSGKSTVINRVIKEDRCEISQGFHFESAMQKIDKTLVISDKEYHCTFLELYGSSDRSQREAQLLSIGKVNLIMFVLRSGCSFIEIEDAQRLMKLVRDASSISALVITGCESRSDEERMELVDKFKSNTQSKNLAAWMGKGVYTVGFPDLRGDQLPQQMKGCYESVALKDVTKLHELVRGSSYVKAIENHAVLMFS